MVQIIASRPGKFLDELVIMPAQLAVEIVADEEWSDPVDLPDPRGAAGRVLVNIDTDVAIEVAFVAADTSPGVSNNVVIRPPSGGRADFTCLVDNPLFVVVRTVE